MGEGVFVLAAVAQGRVGFFLAGGVLGGLDLLEGEHGEEVLDAGESVGGRTADALGGGIWGDEGGEEFFEVLEFAVELVVLMVADEGLGEDVVGVVVAADLVSQVAVAGFGLGGGHGVWGARTTRKPRSLQRLRGP